MLWTSEGHWPVQCTLGVLTTDRSRIKGCARTFVQSARRDALSSASLSVADRLRTSSKGPGLARVASRRNFRQLRARLEGLEPPTNGFEGRMRRTHGLARLRNRMQPLRMR